MKFKNRNIAYQQCVRCVMDTSDPLIQFDKDGVCNLCTDFINNRKQVIKSSPNSNTALDDLFKTVKAKSTNRKYDCIIGMSGGVDSSYLAVLASKYKLRILAVHMDNGWNSPVSVENIKRVVEKIGCDYASYVLPWKDFKKVQLAFLKASVPEAETPTDVAIAKATHFYALKTGTKFILSGGNVASEGILPMSWHYNARDTLYSHSILRAFGSSPKEFKTQRFGFLEEFYCKFIRNIKIIYPLNYHEYDKNKARKMLEDKYGWQYYGSKHGESRYTKFIQKYYLVKKHGIDYRKATFSSEICLRKISRDDAIKILKISPYKEGEFEDEKIYIAKKLSINNQELEDIINSDPKWFWNYKNNLRVLHFFYDLYRKIYRLPKTSNH